MSKLTEGAQRYGVAPEKHNDVYDAISPTRLAKSMEGKVVLVTGAGRGIGRSIALAFAEAGADLAILARTKSQLDEVAEIIKSKFGRRCLVFVADAVDDVAVQAAVDETERTLGPLDVVIPNAAVGGARPFDMSPFEEWWKIMEINVKGPMMLINKVLSGMKQRNSGSIIIISSRAGVVNVPAFSAYCASKAALIRAAGCIQLELDAIEKSGVQIYSMHPGGVKTAMNEEDPHPDSNIMKPGYVEHVRNFRAAFADTPELSAWTCVYLASGKGVDVLRGRYIDVEHDIDSIVKQGEIVQKEGLYDMTVKLLGNTSV